MYSIKRNHSVQIAFENGITFLNSTFTSLQKQPNNFESDIKIHVSHVQSEMPLPTIFKLFNLTMIHFLECTVLELYTIYRSIGTYLLVLQLLQICT